MNQLIIICPDVVIREIEKKFNFMVVIKHTNPFEGSILFHSKKARDFFADYLENKYFMTSTGYNGRLYVCCKCGYKSENASEFIKVVKNDIGKDYCIKCTK